MRFRIPALPLLCLLVALAPLGLAPSAQASVSWVIRGHGFGHGVGMSQYGAYGYALHGKGYRFILGHYYPGTQIGTLSAEPMVRVLLDVDGDDVGFSGATGACGQALEPGREYEAHRAGASVSLRTASGRPLVNCGHKLGAAGQGRIEIAGTGAYRGALEVVPTESDPGSLNVINALPVDQYVKGVIPNESPASWPPAALRAQAVAARSYGLSAQVDGNGFDLYADARSQVYDGLESETASSNEAAEQTRGQIVTYNGHVAETLFSACSGGHTESIQNVFGGSAIPYLRGVPDPYDYYCPLHEWKLEFSGPQISAKLGGYLDGRLKKIVIAKTGASPRILSAKLYGTGGISTVSGTELESALGGYDTWMTFRKLVDGKPATQPSG